MSLLQLSSRLSTFAPIKKAVSLTILRGYATKKYTMNHEWISFDKEVGTVGITDHAQKALGDVVYVELPTVENEVVQAEQMGCVESVKASCDIYSPASGEVLEVNTALIEEPGLVNESPEDKGWLVKIRLIQSADLNSLMDEDQYAVHCASENETH
ncbi:unnamed protein product [Absidia cylindrospora]